MAIYGDQWLCPCGWSNLFVRTRCRNCGEPKLGDEKLQSAMEVVQSVRALAAPPPREAD